MIDTPYRETLPTEIACVYDFHQKFGFIVNTQPTHVTRRLLTDRVAMIMEETSELYTASTDQDMEKILDALIDLTYFVYGTVLQLGLGHVWTEAFREVHRANMAKERGTGHRGMAHDVIKPAGWHPPRLGLILGYYGYNRTVWMNPMTGEVDDNLCDDVDRPIRRTVV
jgi:predicted HAD superfamily Cof-like phosphohydrolase